MDEILLVNIEWQPLFDKLSINKNIVNLFKISVRTHYDRIKSVYSEILSKKELDKATRFINSKDMERYIVSRYLLRNILSEFTSTVPSLIEFHQSANKKPMINEIQFNTTHDGDYIIIATSPTPIGIDIEYVNKRFDFEPLLTTCFGLDELSFINNGKNRLLNFYTLWTRKEAILKATGEGLTDDLNQITCLNPSLIRNQTKYELKSLTIDDDYIMSLAATTGENQLNYWNYE